jgi:hypothetical protein
LPAAGEEGWQKETRAPAVLLESRAETLCQNLFFAAGLD